MSVYQTMNQGRFIREFNENDLRKDRYSDVALTALFEYLDGQEEDIRFDIVKICSDWVEVQTEEQRKEYEENYGIITEIELPLNSGWLLQIDDVR